MKLKLDENLSRHLKPVLTGLGHDVLTAADEGLLSRPDVEVAARAPREGRILLSLDIEFADLRKYPPGSHCSDQRYQGPRKRRSRDFNALMQTDGHVCCRAPFVLLSECSCAKHEHLTHY